MTTPQPNPPGDTTPAMLALADSDDHSLRLDDHDEFVRVSVLDPHGDFDAVDLDVEQAAELVATLQNWISSKA